MTTRVCERCKRLYRNSGLEFRESVGRFLITYPSDRTSREWLCRSHLEGMALPLSPRGNPPSADRWTRHGYHAMTRADRLDNHDPYWLKFLTPRAYDPLEHLDWLCRAAYAYPHREHDDRPLLLNDAWGPAPFTLEDALVWAERRARAVLG